MSILGTLQYSMSTAKPFISSKLLLTNDSSILITQCFTRRNDYKKLHSTKEGH